MAKKEVQVFSMSFLDLLSGALAAVIILFIIVPKMDSESQDALEALEGLGAEIDQLDEMINSIEHSVDEEIFQELQAQFEDLQEALEEAKERVEQLEQENEQLEAEIENLEQQLEEIQNYREWMENCGYALDDPCPPQRQASRGFQYQGKNIVFIIDVSGSMQSSSEDRLSPVKAGIKMLLATMNDQYQTDLIRFPYISDCDYQSHFGQLKVINENNRQGLYSFLRSLNAGGGTPIKESLEYVLDNYSNVTDVVLLTDGVPGCRSSDDPEILVPQILDMVRQRNTGGIQMNAIGVGRDFFDDPSSLKVTFLEDLTAQNGNGFFIQFD